MVIIAISVFVGFHTKSGDAAFWERFEAVVYGARSEEIRHTGANILPLQISGTKKLEWIKKFFDPLVSNGLKEGIEFGLSDRFLVVFSDDFSSVLNGEHKQRLLSFPWIYMRKDRKEFLNKKLKQGCFVNISINNTTDKIHSFVMVSNMAERSIREKCLLYFFLRIEGIEFAAFDQMEDFITKKNDQFVLNDFAFQILFLISKSSPAERQSKAKMKKFIETNYPVGKKTNN